MNNEILTRLTNLENAFLQFAQNSVVQTQIVDKNKSDISVNTSDISAAQSKILQMSSDISGTWNAKDIYTAETYVMHNGELYVCLIQNVNTEPSANPIFWKKTDIASELNKLLSLIKGEN